MRACHPWLPAGRPCTHAAAALALLGLAIGAAACCSAGDPDCDPLESFNRPVQTFNDTVDTYLAGPVASVYVAVVPPPVRHGVANFFDNVSYPKVVFNDILQGKVGQGGLDILRFVVNTTLGLGGMLDVATRMGLEEHEEDLGQSLAVWGVGEGAYLVLPLAGPSSLRDAPDKALGRVTSLLFFVQDPKISAPATVLSGVDQRARAAAALRAVKETAVDRYVFLREAYRQHRIFLIYDGHPPTPEIDPDLLDMDEAEDGDQEKNAPTSPTVTEREQSGG